MTPFAQTGMTPGGLAIRCAGGIAPAAVNALYPMKALTAFHVAHHLPGLTGRWMDTGATALGGAVRGSFHRLVHGHHLFEDGFKVLAHPRLKFGHFLHHLGMDVLTVRGIPNPLLPTALGPALVKLGLSRKFVYEFMTLNVPKILGGGLSLVCAGHDVWLAFSDAIPHTWTAAGLHFGLGCLETAFGLFPPNFLALTAGACEFVVSAVTAWRTIVDPVIPALGVPGSVFFPALGHAVALAGILGACGCLLAGKSIPDAAKSVASGMAAAAAGRTAAFAAAAAGGFLGPFAGPLAGFATYFLAKKTLDFLFPSAPARAPFSYRELPPGALPDVFSLPRALPLVHLPREPIGRLSGDRLLLDESAIRRSAETALAAAT